MKHNLSIAFATMRNRKKTGSIGPATEAIESNRAESKPTLDTASIVDGVLKRKMSNGGQVIEDDGLRNEDDFLTAKMSPADFGHETYPDPDNTEHEINPEEDPKMRRKMVIASIFKR